MNRIKRKQKENSIKNYKKEEAQKRIKNFQKIEEEMNKQKENP